MGRVKQLIVHAGEPLVRRAAGCAVAAGADPVIVVVGAHAAEVEAAVSGLAGIRVVRNPGWESGLASSLALGLGAAIEEESCDGILVTLADQPLVDAGVLGPLMAAFRAGARIVASGYDGVPGVPALFGREHAPALMGLTGDAGAGGWMRDRLADVTIIPLERAAHDLDTPEDLARLADPGSFS